VSSKGLWMQEGTPIGEAIGKKKTTKKKAATKKKPSSKVEGNRRGKKGGSKVSEFEKLGEVQGRVNNK